jgi:hypothetical protein
MVVGPHGRAGRFGEKEIPLRQNSNYGPSSLWSSRITTEVFRLSDIVYDFIVKQLFIFIN